MQIDKLKKKLEERGEIVFTGSCHDCGVPVKVRCYVNEKGQMVVEGGAMYDPKVGTPPETQQFFKCDQCFAKDPILRNHQPCEVFSRVVGYLRPLTQWNKGKQEEFKKRKEFEVGTEH